MMKHGYLIDMDGVLYLGKQLIPGSDYFINQLRAKNIPFRLLTNNSQRTRRDVVTKLSRLGIDVEEEHVFTSAMATARFLAHQKPNGIRWRGLAAGKCPVRWWVARRFTCPTRATSLALGHSLTTDQNLLLTAYLRRAAATLP